MFNWRFVTSAQFAAGTKNENDLYFLSDSHEIYRGSTPFNQAVTFYTTLPTEGIATNHLYIDSATLEGKVHNGTSWVTVIKAVDTTVTSTGTNAVSGAAVVTYVTAQLESITQSSDIITDLSWDSDNQILTMTKGDSSTATITFDGVGVGLQYTASTGKLQLLDASGNTIGDDISLDLERFISSGIYDSTTQSIILYFDEAKTDSVTIPVADLVDTYTAQALDASLSLSVSGSAIQGKVVVSTTSDNILTVDDNGLYVPKTDISGKMDKATGAVSNNIAVFDSNGQAVDSGKSFDDIVSTSSVYIGTTLDDALTGVTPVKNDVAIVRKQIGETDKYERNCYIYDGETWDPMDENYNAENVYFPEDLITTKAIGNISLTNGQATISAAGKNLKQVWEAIFVSESNPTIIQPALTLTASNNKAYEVGTIVTPIYSASLSTGTYSYNSPTSAGITASSWSVTDTDGHALTTNTGSFDSFTVADDSNYTITAVATYEASTITPVTNLGNDYTAGIIAAGSKSKTSSAITGYRCMFYGTVDNVSTDMDSALIRTLTSSASPSNGTSFTVTIPVGARRVIIAYPSSLQDITSIKDVNGLNAESVTAFTSTTVDVYGVNEYTSAEYKLYYLDYAEANDTANTYTVVI